MHPAMTGVPQAIITATTLFVIRDMTQLLYASPYLPANVSVSDRPR